MFVLKKNATAWWPVKVKLPDPKSAGREVTHEFDIEVRLLEQDEIEAQEEGRKAIIDQAARDAANIGGDDADAVAAAESESLTKRLNEYANQTFLDTITNWRNVRGEDGKAEIAFSDDLLRQALGMPRVRSAIVTAVYDAIHGARAKN